MNKYEILNQQYGNILSYFELPANSFWQIVSLKGPWKILLKAPIFLFTESFFPTVWKFLWWFLLFWFSILLHRSIYSGKDKIILTLLIFAFAPFQIFDLEYASLFFAVSSLYFFFKTRYNFYLFLYFLFGLYACISRSDFFIFFSFLNFFFLINPHFNLKLSRKITYVAGVSILFLSVVLLLNKIYYGGFFILWYEVQSWWASNFSSSENSPPTWFFYQIIALINRFFGFLLPFWFKPINIFDNLWYVLSGYTGILFIFLLPSLLSKKITSHLDFSFKLIVMSLALYGFSFYGSDANSFKPASPQFSSYTRYFCAFLFCLWIFLYWSFFTIWRFFKILFSSFLLISIYSGIHFAERPKNDLYSVKYINQIRWFIPQGSFILPLRPVQFLLSDYKVLQPSGEDSEEYKVFFTFWRTSRPTSLFLEKIVFFITDSKNPVYVVWQGQYFVKIIDFFKRYEGKIIIESHPGYTVIRPI